jgi:hypothetical protein
VSDPAVEISSGGWVELLGNGGESFTRYDWRAGLSYPAEFADYTASLTLLDSVHWPSEVLPFGPWIDELDMIDHSSGYSIEADLYEYPSEISDDEDAEPEESFIEDQFEEED